MLSWPETRPKAASNHFWIPSKMGKITKNRDKKDKKGAGQSSSSEGGGGGTRQNAGRGRGRC